MQEGHKAGLAAKSVSQADIEAVMYDPKVHVRGASQAL